MEGIHELLVPYALTLGRNADYLRLDLDLDEDVEVLPVEDDDTSEFADLLNHSNQLAFGGPRDMGMPRWVMLDCAILPTAMVGFMLAPEDTPDELWDLLDIEDDYDGWVPVSEYCAALTVEPGCVCGFSLHSHISSQGIATRTKALALAVLGAKSQIGVTQFNNPAIRVHARFGPMEVLLHRPAIHTHNEDSFVYRLELPEEDVLEDMARHPVEFGVPDRPDGLSWEFEPGDERSHVRLGSHLGEGGRAWIVSPGWQSTEDGCKIDMVLGE